MKNPTTHKGRGAFLMAVDATLGSSSIAMPQPQQATKNEQRFRWCSQSNSVCPLNIRKGTIWHG